jgi:two-component system, chemotaxis family, chemotaxis protein CheY
MVKRPILLIEDDANLAMLIEHMLRDHYRVSILADGHSALSWLAAGNVPELIMADIDMPGLDCIHLLDNLRVSGFFRHIPVLVLSGATDKEKARRSLNHGASGILEKPFARELLFEELGRLVPAE